MSFTHFLKSHPTFTGSVISLFIGFALPFIFMFSKLIWMLTKRDKLQEEYEELLRQKRALEEEITRLENYKADLERKISYFLEQEVKERVEEEYRRWLEERKRKVEEEIGFKAYLAMKEAAEKQEKVYADTMERLKDTFKENARLKEEIAKLRQHISNLKSRFSNHVITVVRNAKFEMLIHALKQRPDKKNIANALK